MCTGAGSLCAVLSHPLVIQASMERNFFFILLKICQAVLKHGEQAKEAGTAAKVGFLVFLTGNTTLEQRKLAFLGHVLVGGGCWRVRDRKGRQ